MLLHGGYLRNQKMRITYLVRLRFLRFHAGDTEPKRTQENKVIESIWLA